MSSEEFDLKKIPWAKLMTEEDWKLYTKEIALARLNAYERVALRELKLLQQKEKTE